MPSFLSLCVHCASPSPSCCSNTLCLFELSAKRAFQTLRRPPPTFVSPSHTIVVCTPKSVRLLHQKNSNVSLDHSQSWRVDTNTATMTARATRAQLHGSTNTVESPLRIAIAIPLAERNWRRPGPLSQFTLTRSQAHRRSRKMTILLGNLRKG
jgi:hypothetical protein